MHSEFNQDQFDEAMTDLRGALANMSSDTLDQRMNNAMLNAQVEYVDSLVARGAQEAAFAVLLSVMVGIDARMAVVTDEMIGLFDFGV